MRTPPACHRRSKSTRAVAWVMFATSTYVERGKASAVARAPSGEVSESRSPAKTKVGTRG